MIHKLRDIALVLLPVVLLSACDSESETAKKSEVIRPVRAIKVADPTTLTRGSLPGRAKATREVNLAFRVAGPLITFPVEVGDKVETGTVLARIDPRDFDVRLRNAEARLAGARSGLAAMRVARPEDIRKLKAAVQKDQAAVKLAKQDFDRLMRIKAEDPGAISQSMIDRRAEQKESAEAELRQTKEELRIGQLGARAEDIAAQEAEIASLAAALDAAQDDLGYTYLRAPFDGTVVATYVDNFENVQEQQRILRLLDTSRIEMVVDIPETMISNVAYVTNITVRFDAFPDLEIPAEIKEIGTEASETTRTYPVTLVMDQPEGVTILPGMAGRTFGTGHPPGGGAGIGMEIPVSAVFSPDTSGKSYVWVIDAAAKTAAKREVKLGELTNLGIIIRDGLVPGEWVATAGVHTLSEGQQVRILAPEIEG